MIQDCQGTKRIESAHVQKGEVVDALVCLPNSTLRLSQSEKKKKSLTSGKKRKSVKELKEEEKLTRSE